MPRPRTLPTVAAASTVAVVLCTPPLGLANARTRGPPMSRRSTPIARCTSTSGAVSCHSMCEWPLSVVTGEYRAGASSHACSPSQPGSSCHGCPCPGDTGPCPGAVGPYPGDAGP
jgi:hypothetical protein